MTEEFDWLNQLVLGELLTGSVVPLQPDTLIPVLIKRLACKILELLFVGKRVEVLYWDGGLCLIPLILLLAQLPEPLVDLAFVQLKFSSKLGSLLARRHLALVLSKYFRQNFHLLGILALATINRCCRIMWLQFCCVFPAALDKQWFVFRKLL